MPGWFGKRGSGGSSSSTNKEESQQLQLQKQDEINSHGKKNHVTRKKSSGSCRGSSSGGSSKDKEKGKNKSFDEAAALSLMPRNQICHKDFLSGFSGFDSDSAERRTLPLPRPSLSDRGAGFGSGSGSASGSVSSVSSSGSSGDDHPDHHASHIFGGCRTNGEIKFNIGSRGTAPGSRSPCPGSRSPCLGSRSPAPGSRSPVPGSRGTSRPTSPLHPRLCGTSLDSPSGRPEDGRNQCHPLPLPPGSPTSPSSLASTRINGTTENTPAMLSKWKKGKLLGRGTFGHVYLGFNSESGQMCAIKEVRVVSDDQASKESLKQLNQEINLLSQLSHANIVRYYGSELSEETLSVYLEYVSGGSIHKLVQDYGPFKEPVIQNYTRQILSGLAYLHGRSTVHRDIKGANILVDPNGEIKLADFGMAKHITACSSMLSFKGSPYWMAPEVVMNTNGYNLAVDIWSLGCTILEMATSKPPWSQYEGVAAIFKIGNSKDMPDIPIHLSNDAKSFIKLCLQRDPSARPTASQLLEHPFIQDQPTRVAGFNIARDGFSFDGSRTPPALDLHPIVTKSNSSDGDHAVNPFMTNMRVLKRDDVRMITSLPVSRCSSPLRQYGPAHNSCFLSPPHSAYALAGQSGYNLSDYSLYPVMPNTKYTQDPSLRPLCQRSKHPVYRQEQDPFERV